MPYREKVRTLLTVAITVLFICLAVYSVRRAYFLQYSVNSEGVVYSVLSAGEAGNKAYYFYIVEDETYTGSFLTYSGDKNAYPVGEKYSIVYSIKNPTVSRIDIDQKLTWQEGGKLEAMYRAIQRERNR